MTVYRPASPPRRRAILRSGSEALDHAHAQGILHQDLKPANMMLRNGAGPLDPSHPLPQDVQVVLTDLRVARLPDATDSPYLIVGIPTYMSRRTGFWRRSRFAFRHLLAGGVLDQMLAGRVPFEGSDGTVWTLLEDHQRNGPPTIPHAFLPVQDAVYRSLAKGPGTRNRRAEKTGGSPRRCNQPRRSRILIGPLSLFLVVR